MFGEDLEDTGGVFGCFGLPCGLACGKDGIHFFGCLGLTLYADDFQLALDHIDMDEVAFLNQGDRASETERISLC